MEKLIVKNGIIQNKTIGGVPVRIDIVEPYGDNNVRTLIKLDDRHRFTVHETGNFNKGATASMHTKYFQNLENADETYLGAHIFVDEDEILQVLPLNEVAYHAGDSEGNNTSIGIEMAVNGDVEATRENTKKLGIAYLLAYPDTLFYRHYDWNEKWCPYLLMNEGEKAWDDFVADIRSRAKGEKAPVENDKPSEQFPKSKEEAIAYIAPLVQKYYKEGVSALPSVMIAQVMLETAFGTSELLLNANNPAGIKFSSPYDVTYNYYEKVSPEWVKGQETSQKSKFVKFPSLEVGIENMAKHMISTPTRKGIYTKVLNSKTYKDQAKGLSETWTTDPNYGKKLIEIIEKYNLTKYDSKPVEESNPEEEITITIPKAGTYVIRRIK